MLTTAEFQIHITYLKSSKNNIILHINTLYLVINFLKKDNFKSEKK